MYDRVCAVSIKTGDAEGTCSGILIDSKRGLLLTHASLIYPLIDKVGKGKLGRLIRDGNGDQRLFSDPVKIYVYLPYGREDTDEDVLSNSQQVHLVNSLSTRTQEQKPFVTLEGKLKMFFVCEKLRNTLLDQMPSETWQFVEDLNSTHNNIEQKLKLDKQKEEICYRLLPFFIIIKLLEPYPTSSVLSIRDSVDNKPGNAVEICATPFGVMSPEVFLNAKSHGIISKLAGPRGVLLMTDARCIPGCEGGALFYCHKGKRWLTGIMIASLCWKNNEWIGLSLACAISEVMGSLRSRAVLDFDTLPREEFSSGYEPSFITHLTAMVPCVNVGHNWGSGVFLDETRGLVLTCSHVLNPASKNRERIDVDDQPYDIVYRTPQKSQFDLAIIRSGRAPGSTFSSRNVSFAKAVEGEVVYIVGHAVWRGGCGLLPLVTRGVVSKIVRHNKIPIMLQTTCAVHAGASGGGVFNTKGQLVALVVCNSRDSLSGASYPHLNMSVPMETVASIIIEFLKTEDVSVLKSLHIRNDAVRRMWSIDTEDTATISHL